MTGAGKRTRDRGALDLRPFRVVNASGHMTSLGATLSAGVVDAMRQAAGAYCDMERLHDWAAETIVRVTGADAALVVVMRRDHRMGEGILALDPRPLSDADVDVVIAAVEAFFRA